LRNRRAGSNRWDRDRDDDDDAGGWLRSHPAFLRWIGWSARDAVAFMVAACATVAILVNALFLQTGPHPAPLFKTSLSVVAPAEATSTVAVPRARPPEAVLAKAEVPKAAPAAAPARNDAIADMLTPSKRVMALQRVLAQFGYGQIKPSGIVDAETRAAIEKFERERKLPITGQPSERLTQELVVVTGRPLN